MSHIGYEAAPLSRQDIRSFALQVREGLGFGSIPYVDVEVLLDLVLPRVLPDFAYAICPRAEMGNNHGLASPDARWIKLREDVFERACGGAGRDRLTIIHELAHLLLHTKERVMLRRAVGAPMSYRDPEWQADCFAGEFLMSAKLLDGCRSIADLVNRFGVTPTAAEVQWKQFRNARLL